MSKSVYCKDCIYRSIDKSICRCPKVMRKSAEETERFRITINYPGATRMLNANNDCEHYRRKPWKFWRSK